MPRELFDAKSTEGLLILAISNDSPAEAAGLKAGDILSKIAGVSLSSKDDLEDALDEIDDRDEFEIEFIRKAKRDTASIQRDKKWSWDHRHGRRHRFRLPRFYFHCDDDFEDEILDMTEDLEETIRESGSM